MRLLGSHIADKDVENRLACGGDDRTLRSLGGLITPAFTVFVAVLKYRLYILLVFVPIHHLTLRAISNIYITVCPHALLYHKHYLIQHDVKRDNIQHPTAS